RKYWPTHEPANGVGEVALYRIHIVPPPRNGVSVSRDPARAKKRYNGRHRLSPIPRAGARRAESVGAKGVLLAKIAEYVIGLFIAGRDANQPLRDPGRVE